MRAQEERSRAGGEDACAHRDYGDEVPSAAHPHAGAAQLAAPLAPPPHDERLDFFSPRFDALLALTTPGVQPPQPGARPLDYLAKCRALLPSEMEARARARARVAPPALPL
jgi:hypothetical protein